jgi:hypothetical protein
MSVRWTGVQVLAVTSRDEKQLVATLSSPPSNCGSIVEYVIITVPKSAIWRLLLGASEIPAYSRVCTFRLWGASAWMNGELCWLSTTVVGCRVSLRTFLPIRKKADVSARERKNDWDERCLRNRLLGASTVTRKFRVQINRNRRGIRAGKRKAYYWVWNDWRRRVER